MIAISSKTKIAMLYLEAIKYSHLLTALVMPCPVVVITQS
jgi:hypothetical protein